MVPAEAGGGAVTSFEGRDVEQSLAGLTPPVAQAPPAADAFESAPFTVKVDDGRDSRRKGRRQPKTKRPSLTLPIWAPYAYGVVILLVAVGAFLLGAWWATSGGGS